MTLLTSPQDGVLLGAVGAYGWTGAVLKDTKHGKVVPPKSSYEEEFPEELKNHGAYLGKETHPGPGAPPGLWKDPTDTRLQATRWARWSPPTALSCTRPERPGSTTAGRSSSSPWRTLGA